MDNLWEEVFGEQKAPPTREEAREQEREAINEYIEKHGYEAYLKLCADWGTTPKVPNPNLEAEEEPDEPQYIPSFFAPFGGDELKSVGIDGFESVAITRSSFIKFIEKKLEKDPAKVLKEVSTGNPFYVTLREKAEREGRFVSRKVRKGNSIQQTTFYQLDIGCDNIMVIVTEFDKELMDLALKNKKKYNNYVRVSFQSLHQPSKVLKKEGCDAYAKFLKRFAIKNLDLAADLEQKAHLEDGKLMSAIIDKHYNTYGVRAYVPKGVESINHSVYFNFKRTEENTRATAPKYESFLIYNKCLKQNNVHEDDVSPLWHNWLRIEVKVEIGGKFNKSYDIINEHLQRFSSFLSDPLVMGGRIADSSKYKMFNLQLNAVKSKKLFKSDILPHYNIFSAATSRCCREYCRSLSANFETDYIINSIAA